MQKNVPKYTPEWVRDGAGVGRGVQARRLATRCATTGGRCCGSPTSGPSSTTRRWSRRTGSTAPTHLVLDLDPPEGGRLRHGGRRGRTLVRQALADVGLAGAVKTSGAKGVHVFVPIDAQAPMEDAAAATRAIAARAERLDPDVGHDRVHQGGPRRQGVRRLDPRRRGDRRRRLQPAGPSGRARCRSRSPGTSSTT